MNKYVNVPYDLSSWVSTNSGLALTSYVSSEGLHKAVTRNSVIGSEGKYGDGVVPEWPQVEEDCLLALVWCHPLLKCDVSVVREGETVTGDLSVGV